MTLHDLLKRVKASDWNKVIIFSDANGWSNVDVEIADDQIVIRQDFSMPFEEYIIKSK